MARDQLQVRQGCQEVVVVTQVRVRLENPGQRVELVQVERGARPLIRR